MPFPHPSPATAILGSAELICGLEVGLRGNEPIYFNICRPINPPKVPMPAVLHLHGGGWFSGSYKGSNEILALAQKGYFAVAVSYRLSGEAKWPAQLEDCKFAVRWLRAHAEEYQVDPDRIGVWGGSAGGHLAACLGLLGGEAQFEGTGGYPEMSSKVQAVVDFSGPTDFAFEADDSEGRHHGTPDLSTYMVNLAGATHEERPDLWKEASPMTYVKPGAPPFLIVHGDHDECVPLRHTEAFARALHEAGNQPEVLIVKNGNHCMGNIDGLPPASPDAAGLQKIVEDFFAKNL